MKKICNIIIFILILLLTGCSETKKTSISIDVKVLSPQQLVETYYKSLGQGENKIAKSCLSTDYANQINDSPYSDFKNLKKIADIKVQPEAPIELYGKNYSEVQVVAEYTATYKQVITTDNGKQLRFIYVAKKEKASPWKIISIGTGP